MNGEEECVKDITGSENFAGSIVKWAYDRQPACTDRERRAYLRAWELPAKCEVRRSISVLANTVPCFLVQE